MVFEYAQLRGTLDGMDSRVITEIADYISRETHYELPPMTPFVGKNFNVTKAGIHADGLLKDPEIYNIFDTEALLDRPPLVAVSNVSGLAGIACWINNYYRLAGENTVSKKDPFISKMKEWIDKQYDEGRITVISDEEMVHLFEECAPEVFAKVARSKV